MTTDQAAFATALLDPQLPVPAGVVAPDGGKADQRFAVYRNNVVSGLADALDAAFPAVRGLVGSAFFRATATVFARAHPPESPVLMLYGAAFPAFLEGFEPVRGLPYLPDLARLEQARREAYHAADMQPIDPDRLLSLTPGELAGVRLGLAPAVRLVRSRWPLTALHRSGMEGQAVPAMTGENVLVTRPAFDPEMTVLQPGGGTCLAALVESAPLGEAADRATKAAADFDLAAFLGTMLAGRAIISITTGSAP